MYTIEVGLELMLPAFPSKILLYIWESYGNGGSRGKVCVVFDFGRLRSTLNGSFPSVKLECGGIEFASFFSINYGLADYVDRETHRANLTNLPNPITYAFLKDKKYARELRVCLSAEAIWAGYSANGVTIQFPTSLRLPFDFKAAITDKTILEIRRSLDADMDFLEVALRPKGIELV